MRKTPKPNKEAEAVRRLSEEVMGWEEDSSNGLSLQYLRELVKGKNERLDKAFKALLDPGKDSQVGVFAAGRNLETEGLTEIGDGLRRRLRLVAAAEGRSDDRQSDQPQSHSRFVHGLSPCGCR